MIFWFAVAQALELSMIPQTGTPPESRYYSKAVKSGDSLLMFGGDNDEFLLNDMWKFNLTSKTWSQMIYTGTEIPQGRNGHAMFVNQRQIYLYGGRTQVGLSGETWKFNLEQETWERLKIDSPPFRAWSGVAYTNEKAWIFGGRSRNHVSNELYEFSGEKWTKLEGKGDIPSKVERCNLVYWNNKLIVWGGVEKDWSFTSLDLYFYNLSTKTWTVSKPLNRLKARHSPGFFVHNDWLYCVFGYDEFGTNYITEIWKLNLNNLAKWELAKNASIGGDGFALVKDGNKAYILQGLLNNENKNSIYELDLPSLDISELSPDFPSPKPRSFHSMLAIDSKFWLFGGKGSNGE